MAYKGSVEIASGLIGLNGRDIPLVHSGSVQVSDNADDRLDDLLEDISEKANNALLKTGGKMVGALILSTEPMADDEAIKKKYVDNITGNIDEVLGSILNGDLSDIEYSDLMQKIDEINGEVV